MASSAFHARSNSFPSRPHPLLPQIDEHLCRLKSNEATSSSLSSSLIGQNLSGLRDLFEFVESFLQLPLTQQSLAQRCNDKQVNELLNGSLRLLDMCGFVKDALLEAKEDTQQLHSILRRRKSDDVDFKKQAKAYLASRRKAKKLIKQIFERFESKYGFSLHENNVEATLSMLREVEGVTFTLFESLLTYISGTKMQSKSTNWSLVSKLMHSKRVTCEGEASETNEFEKVDAVLCTLIDHKARKSSNMSTENVKFELQKLESCIQDFEDGAECLLKLLIKTRVSILNILSH